jgi:hypothetical protein
MFSAAEYFDGFTFPWPDGTPVKTATKSGIEVISEQPEKLAVLHGFSCASSDREGLEDFIRIQENLDLSSLLETDGRWITNATVFLNGFQGRFLDGKRDLLGLGAAVANIEVQRTQLTFEGGGVLAGGQFNSPYEMCYTYTVLAWNRLALNISANHEDQENVFLRLPGDNKSITSLNILRNYRQDIGFIEADTSVAILPRGTGMAWTSANQLLQSSYSLGAASPILESNRTYGNLAAPQNLPDDTSRQGAGGISWDSSFIFKPNDKVKKVFVAEMVSIIGGSDTKILHPPFAIEPDNEKEPCGNWFTGCIVTPADLNEPQTINIVVENLPYDAAVPVLSGWSLGYADDDHTIEQIGINIESFSYEAPTGGQSGTLRYTLQAVTDNGGNYRPSLRYRVGVLGITLGSDTGDGSGPNVAPPELPSIGPVIDN